MSNELQQPPVTSPTSPAVQPAPAVTPRPGWRTTEFWIALLSQVVSVLAVAGFIPGKDEKTLDNAIVGGITALGVVLANLWIILNYIRSRLQVKTAHLNAQAAQASGQQLPKELPTEPRASGPGKMGLMLLLVGSFFFAPAHVGKSYGYGPSAVKFSVEPCCFQIGLFNCCPGRRQPPPQPPPMPPMPPPTPQTDPALLQLLQQMHDQNKQIMDLLVKQQLPIQGQPLQQLPIAGQPLQLLPIQGQPIQLLPIQGQPIQQMPIQGQPIQLLPIAGQPLQQLPDPRIPMGQPFQQVPQQLPQQQPQQVPQQAPQQLPQGGGNQAAPPLQQLPVNPSPAPARPSTGPIQGYLRLSAQ